MLKYCFWQPNKFIKQKVLFDAFKLQKQNGQRIDFLKIIKIKNKMSMRRSPAKSNQDRYQNRSSSATKSRRSNNQSETQSSSCSANMYFCHFKNAIYMGGIKSFQKNGHGILLHDNGTNMISCYYNDLLHGHNIFFRNQCLLSAEYNKNKLVEAVYRTDGFLIYLLYNSDGQLEGRIILLNFMTKSICYCQYKKGVMVEKHEENDYSLLNRVFELKETDFLIGKKHAKVIAYEFDSLFRRHSPVDISCQKTGHKLTIGYYKSSLINGLSFSYGVKNYAQNSLSIGSLDNSLRKNDNNLNSDSEDYFELTQIERGYYMNSQLNGFGEKIFKNGNSYIGQFKNDIFEGHGVLKNVQKRNWVSGVFDGGNLVDLIEYNHEGGDRKFDRIIESYHEKRSNWINNEINLVNWDFFDSEIEKAINTTPNTQTKTLEQRKIEVLRKIQENFICENNATGHSSSTLREIQQFTGIRNNLSKTDHKDSVRKFVRNFIPESENSNNSIDRQNARHSRELDFSKISSGRKSEARVDRGSRISKIRKSRIFEQEEVLSPSKSVDSSFLKLQKVQVKEGNQGQDTTSSKNRSNSRIHQSDSKKASKSYIKHDSGTDSPQGFNRTSMSHARNVGSEQKARDSRKLGKSSRIFNYVNSEEDDITPKFNYNEALNYRGATRQSYDGDENTE